MNRDGVLVDDDDDEGTRAMGLGGRLGCSFVLAGGVGCGVGVALGWTSSGRNVQGESGSTESKVTCTSGSAVQAGIAFTKNDIHAKNVISTPFKMKVRQLTL
jgi:hypothetical protein